MEGYDTNLLGNFFAYPAFARKFGQYSEQSDNYQLAAHWQAGLSNAAFIGSFFGTFLNGCLVNKFGHISTLVGALVALSGFIFIVFFASSAPVLLLGQFLCDLPWGIFASTAPAYASEVLPMCLKSVHDELDQHVLHYRPPDICWCNGGPRQYPQELVIPHSIRDPMAMTCSAHPNNLACTRHSVALRTPGTIRRGQKIFSATATRLFGIRKAGCTRVDGIHESY